MKDKLKKILLSYELRMIAIAFAINCVAYLGGRLIGRQCEHHDFTVSLDETIPFIPWTVFIYIFVCYAFWAANYWLAFHYGKKRSLRFLTGHTIGEAVCFLFYIFLPTTMVRPEITGNTVWDFLLRYLYTVDLPDNLLPSIHCYLSWLCWIAVRDNKKIPAWYRWMSLFLAVLICISTLTVKQHVLWDAIAGISLAELSCAAAALIEKIRDRRQR